MNATEQDGSIQIALAATKSQMCWYYNPATDDSDDNNTASVSKGKRALIRVQPCEESSQQYFFFEPVNSEINNGKNCTFKYVEKPVERKSSKKSKKNKSKNKEINS